MDGDERTTRAPWSSLDGRLPLLAAILGLTLIFSLLIVPLATAPTAPDVLLGTAQLTWWALWNVVALLLAHLVLWPPRGR